MKQEPKPTPLAVSLDDAAKMMSVSIYTVRRLVKAGKLRSAKVGRRVVITIREMERFLNDG